jgi:CRP-like cAMP-binding protein
VAENSFPLIELLEQDDGDSCAPSLRTPPRTSVCPRTLLPMLVQDSPLTRKLGAFVALSETELAVLASLHQRRRTFIPGKDLVHQGQVHPAAYILADGWVCSYKLLPGGTRQIVDFQIPGDFLGLRSVLFRTADHNIEPITTVEASEVLPGDLLEAFAKTPRLATAVLWAASRDEAMVVEHLVDLGRRSALERTVHFLLELGARLKLVGLGTQAGYACPLSQYLLSDALGLSAVHVNRILRQLREDGLLTFRNGRVTFDDFDRLVALADFDKTYLDHDGPLLR